MKQPFQTHLKAWLRMSAEIRCFKEENLETRLSALDLPFFLFFSSCKSFWIKLAQKQRSEILRLLAQYNALQPWLCLNNSSDKLSIHNVCSSCVPVACHHMSKNLFYIFNSCRKPCLYYISSVVVNPFFFNNVYYLSFLLSRAKSFS